MILISLAILGQGRPPVQNRASAGPPPAIVQALSSYIKNAKSLSAEITLTSPGIKDVGIARMVYIRPNKLLHPLKWGRWDFEFIGTERGSWDADMVAKSYSETPDRNWYYPYSIQTDAPALFMPGYLMDGTMHSEKIMGLTSAGHETVNGVEADKLGDVNGRQKAVLYVDHNGKPLRSVTYRGHWVITADVKSLVINAPESAFGSAITRPLDLRHSRYPSHCVRSASEINSPLPAGNRPA